MIVEFCLLILTVLLGLFFLNNARPKNYPPGPVKFPIIGNLHYLIGIQKIEGGMSTVYSKLSQEYGKVFSFDYGSYRAIVLNDYKLIKEAWNNPLLCGRPRRYGSEIRTGGVRRGILFHDGEEWSEQRRFALRHLRDFGFGKRSMETLVLDEISELIEGFRKDSGKPISTITRFNAAVLNALWTITSGDRFQHDDPKLHELVQNIQESLTSSGGRNPLLFMPWVLKLAPGLSGFTKFASVLPVTYNYLLPLARKTVKEYEGGSPQHFAHVYADEIRKTTDKNSSFFGERGEKTLAAVLMDLFQAGAETTSTTLSWFFMYMATFPEIQTKLHKEIDRVLDKRRPSLEDRQSMPYTEAVILETLRYASMIPLGLIHSATEDVIFQNYFIPKDTLIIANLKSCHFDPTIWKNPNDFLPDRFLTADRSAVNRHMEGFVPFSAGKRVCLGETLARDELFLFVTSIFQLFHVTCDPNGPKPDLGKNAGSIVGPRPHKIVMTER